MVNPESIRTVNPSAWPQYPFDTPPKTPESSKVSYSILPEYAVRLKMRDGIELVMDIFRPWAAGQRFPALISWSAYTRQLQQTIVPVVQNESGLTEFWVPRGYVHVLVDARGSNDSEGCWDYRGPEEQQDLVEVIEWVASQPWCNGNVGMTGCSYFAMAQLAAAVNQPPSLKAIFPYDASTDMYRDCFFHGGIPCTGFALVSAAGVAFLNFMGGRLKDPSGLHHHFHVLLGQEYPLYCDYYHQRSTWHRLGRIKIPSYFGCDWNLYNIHLPGAFGGWEGVGDIPKRLLVGPRPIPGRPFAAYHFEALRWYDQWLKGMNTRVMEGPPIQIYIPNEGRWRGENEWPLARTEWRELYLGGQSDREAGQLLDVPGPEGERSYSYDPAGKESRYGRPKLVYRTQPLAQDMEITGPLVLTLVAKSSASDTDWIVTFADECPDGKILILTKGWLRASHREIVPESSKKWKPWHPHDRQIPLNPGQPEEFRIGLVPTSNLFQQGHRVRLEIASCDSLPDNFTWYSETLHVEATNTVMEGKDGSRLLVPIIPR